MIFHSRENVRSALSPPSAQRRFKFMICTAEICMSAPEFRVRSNSGITRRKLALRYPRVWHAIGDELIASASDTPDVVGFGTSIGQVSSIIHARNARRADNADDTCADGHDDILIGSKGRVVFGVVHGGNRLEDAKNNIVHTHTASRLLSSTAQYSHSVIFH